MAPVLAKCRLDFAGVLQTLRRRGQVVAAGGRLEALRGSGVLCTDSRAVTPGDAFLAYKGVAADGHAHVGAALTRQAALLVVEDQVATQNTPVPWIQVKSGRAAWTWLAAEAFGNPQDQLAMLGVTGTNGKTSTVWMAGELLRAAGIGGITIGTLGAYLAPGQGAVDFIPTAHTTPDPDVLFALLAAAVKGGARWAAMEVSSHAICQEKLLPMRFAASAFTSFSRDHLDFHTSLDDYWEAKWRLFTELTKPDGRAVFADGLPRPLALASLAGETYVYGRKAAERAKEWGARNFLEFEVENTGFAGTTLDLWTAGASLHGKVPYFARHALDNFAAAVLIASKAAGQLLGPEFWRSLTPVPGRLEQVVAAGTGPQVVVDYAHTPDALEKTLAVLRPFCQGELIVVFGCGGDRDRGKRPQMGRIAETLADRVYVTSDNPRTEDPERILAEIVAGMIKRVPIAVETDREAAIGHAITEAAAEDMVLIAGKGHETYQILGHEKVPFDDREVARRYLSKK